MHGTCCLHFALFFLLQVFISCFAMAVAVSADIATDQTALLALKAHITSDAHKILAANWSTNSSVCTWTGVACGGSGTQLRVTALNLCNMSFEGTIPSQIGNLTFLVSLSLRNNNFYGFLPNELAYLPHLNYLDFGFNFFSGSIPSGLGSLPKLKSLLLEVNKFTGIFPLPLVNISSLQTINASHNQLSGSMPSKFFNLSSLLTIDLSFNGLYRLPVSVVNHLPKLQELYLSGNRFYGEIPASLFKCRQLQVLSLSDNNFKGSVPAEIGNLTVLEKLYLEHNDFKGRIPRSIGNWSLVKEINFGDNNLTGEMPPEIGNLYNLEIFRFHDNALSGHIPFAFFNISTLKSVQMDGNNLSGSLPSNMGLFLPNLRELRLGGNKLVGIIPFSISNASMLTVMDLSYNLLSGSIHPDCLGNLRNLQVLNLAFNNLAIEPSTPEANFLSSLSSCKHLRRIYLSDNWLNAIPSISIGNLSTSLEQFWARNCKIKGSIPRETGNLTSLIALMLGNNELTGTIPTTIGRMKKLQGLELNDNKLQGAITSNLCQLETLFELSLGGNMLSGSIPECLGNLKTLRYLDLSSNKLSSTIPYTLWSLQDILIINMSSNFISGSLPIDVLRLVVVEMFDLSRNQLSGLLPSDIGSMKRLTYLSLAKNGLEGHIPGSLSDLESLLHLDLSCNSLSGGLPKLSGLIYLTYFNVSFNGLEGEIPNEYPFIKFSADSYIMNKLLCGPPLSPCRIRRSVTNLRFLKLIFPFIGCVVSSMVIWLLVIYNRKMSFRRKTPEFELMNTPAIERFSYLELKQATDGFSGGNLLGIGSSGSVYKGTLQDGMVVAVKVYNVEEEKSLRSFGVECELMHNIGHRNLIRILCSFSSINFKALVMEYMANGSLEKWLYTHNYHLDILQRLDIMIDIASAVKYLHHDYTTTIIHCDLKPSNILLDEDMIAHISDFGIAKLVDPDQQSPTTKSNLMCTIGYVAPEYGLYGILSTKIDVYSFGITLMETFTGKKPTDEMFTGEMSLRRWVIDAVPHEVKRVVDPSLLQAEGEHLVAKMACLSGIMRLAQFCTAESPAERFDMKEVVNILNKIKELLVRNLILGNQ